MCSSPKLHLRSRQENPLHVAEPGRETVPPKRAQDGVEFRKGRLLSAAQITGRRERICSLVVHHLRSVFAPENQAIQEQQEHGTTDGCEETNRIIRIIPAEALANKLRHER